MKSNRNSKNEDRTSKKNTQDAVSSQDDTSQGLRELFEDELKDIYWAEKALVKAIPKMIKESTSEELAAALSDHLSVTKEQVSRVEEIFDSIGAPAEVKKCEAMAGLIKESEQIMKYSEKGFVRDAGIISAAQKVEHYEIASYGTLAAFAKILGENKAVTLLNETLNEEKEADERLSEIAESSINIEAVNAE
ncbi:MAG: ferritin-like domain-containing protein [Bacteroidetes bacterium]|nr:ferritin-like domain-containing protein [Bacteroidota bacterium]